MNPCVSSVLPWCEQWEVMARKEPHKGKSVSKIVKEVKKKGQRLGFPTQEMPDDLLTLAMECQRPDPEERPTMKDVAERIRSIRANPVITVKMVTQEDLGDVKFGYRVRAGKEVPVLDSPSVTGTKTGKVVKAKDGIIAVSAHTNVGKVVQGVHDQVFLKIADGFITVLDPASGDLLLEELPETAPVGPKRRVDGAKESGGVDSLLRVMRTHIACKEVCKLACIEICKDAAQHTTELSKLGAAEALCLVARVWQEDEKLLQYALACLGNLATPATYHGVDMAAAGIATSITEALQLNPECRKTAMIVMMNMSLNGENLPHLQSCAPTIIDVLKNPNEQETVALPAWNFVGNLLQDTSSLDLLLKSGLSEAIVGGLTKYSQDYRFIQPIMAVVVRSAKHSLAMDTFVDVARHVATALKQHCNINGVLINGALAVAALALNPKNISSLIDGKICETYTMLIQTALEDTKSVESNHLKSILPAVHSLVKTSDAARKSFLDAGLIETLQRLFNLAVAENRKDFLQAALFSAFSISSKPGGPKSLASASFCAPLVKVLKTFPLEASIVEPTLFIMIQTVQGVPNCSSTLGDAEACEAAVIILANNVDNSHLADLSIQMICLLSNLKENKDRLAAVNARSSVQAATEKHRGSGGLQNNAKIALMNL